jgi:hypothetical protein
LRCNPWRKFPLIDRCLRSISSKLLRRRSGGKLLQIPSWCHYRVTPVEATLFGTQNQVPVYEKTDKEKFDERYTTEQERFEQDLSYVERQYYKTSALRNEKKKVYERHKTWIRDEDIQFQTYYPEYPDWCSEKLAKLDRERRGLN